MMLTVWATLLLLLLLLLLMVVVLVLHLPCLRRVVHVVHIVLSMLRSSR